MIGKIGIIHRVTDKGDIRVSFDGPDNRWTIFPGALTKLSCSYLSGDYVRINSDEEIVKNLQKGHGEWSENMRMVKTFSIFVIKINLKNFTLIVENFNRF